MGIYVILFLGAIVGAFICTIAGKALYNIIKVIKEKNVPVNYSILLYPAVITAAYSYLFFNLAIEENSYRFYIYFYGATMAVVLTKFLIARIAR